MRIASREKAPGRTHRVAGKDWTFAPEKTDGPNVCKVDDPAAQAVFLDPRNANLFYALDAPAPLTRTRPAAAPPAPDLSLLAQPVVAIRKALAAGDIDHGTLHALREAEAAGAARKTILADLDARLNRQHDTSEAGAQAALILDNDEAAVVEILTSIKDQAILQAAREHEQAHGRRATVLNRIEALLA